MNKDAVRDQLLSEAEDDWVGLWELPHMATTVGHVAQGDDALHLIISVLREALEEGLIEVGEVTRDGFNSWNMSPDDACERIEREWRRFPDGPRLGDSSCWVNLTDRGKRSRCR